MRARDLAVAFGRHDPGARNAITDVAGVAVGHRTLVDPPDVNTGVTAIRPRDGGVFDDPVRGSAFVLNGFGKSTGLMQVREVGEIETPIAFTNTLDAGTAASALVDHTLAVAPDARSVNPLVLECNDGRLSDIRGRHVTPDDVRAAVDAAGSSVGEGAVGAGRGMTAFGRKGGVGTASRRVEVAGDSRVVGVLVLSNFGRLRDLRVGGVPVGRRLAGDQLGSSGPDTDGGSDPETGEEPGGLGNENASGEGSIAMVVGTDAALSARQLGRVAKRAPLGMARTGGYAHHGSGDLAVAFSTADPDAAAPPDDALDDAFEAAVDATEEAVLNSLLAAEPVTGPGGTVPALDAAAVRDALRAHPWSDAQE